MKFQFECRVCGKCCKEYKIIINLVDALRIFHNTRQRFYDNFKLVNKNELQVGGDYLYKFFKIQNKEYLLSIISDPLEGCVFLQDNKCAIHNFKPSVCFFYPLKFHNETQNFTVEKHSLCNGLYNAGFSDWPDLENKFSAYSDACEWHNSIVDYWNEHYSFTADEKDFVIFFYEILYPIFLNSN